MKKHVILCGMIALGVACAPLAMANEATDSQSHHFVKDSAITTKVKAKLAAKHLSTLTRIKVDTDADGVVWLSGRAPTKDASRFGGDDCQEHGRRQLGSQRHYSRTVVLRSALLA